MRRHVVLAASAAVFLAGCLYYLLTVSGEGGKRGPELPAKKEPSAAPKRPPAPAKRKAAPSQQAAGGIGGTVRDSKGRPVWRAEVRLLLGPYHELRRAFTRRDGRFFFSGCDASKVYSVQASTDDAAPVRIDDVEVGTGDLVLQLTRGARLVATCLSDDVGMPIRSFTVHLEGPESLSVPVENPDGAFTIGGLPGGTYRVYIEAEGYRSTTPKTLTIQEGQEVRENFFLVPQPR